MRARHKRIHNTELWDRPFVKHKGGYKLAKRMVNKKFRRTLKEV